MERVSDGHVLRRLDLFLSLATLFGFAVAQPLLDVFGRNAGFFVARDATAFDLIMFAATIAIVVPLVLSAMVIVCSAINRRAGQALHAGIFAFLATLFVVRIVRRPLADIDWLAVPVSVGCGVAIAAAYRVSGGVRTAVRLASGIVPVALALFLLVAPSSRLVLTRADPVASGSTIDRLDPVVLVMLDELPLVSLMDRKGRIDRRLFPNFARLATDGTWYRNALATHEFTDRSVPAILTGRHPDNVKLATYAEHPTNLFTLLARTHDIVAVEPITRLCPTTLCARSGNDEDVFSRWRSLTRDAAVVAGKMVLPNVIARHLPSIDQSWGHFGRADRGGGPELDDTDGAKPGGVREKALVDRFWSALESDRPQGFRTFVDRIKDGPRPGFYFIHTMLPHPPWQYVGSGKRYTEEAHTPGVGGNITTSDRWLALQGYQRHLMQAQLVDSLIGYTVARLESQGMYDRTMVIVTSDHGASFRPGAPRRVITEGTKGEIGPVPLFIKLPRQKRGGIDDRPVQSIDIVPTIGDVLGARLPWPADGLSLRSRASRAPRARSVLRGDATRVAMSSEGTEKYGALLRKLSMFAAVGDSIDLGKLGPRDWHGIVGRRASELVIGSSTAAGTVEDRARYRRIDPRQPSVPVLVTGTINGRQDKTVVAVVVDGTVAAVTRTFEQDDKSGRFYAVIPLQILGRGTDDIHLYEMTGALRLAPIASAH